jgi:glycerol uptake operon antiterminator
VDTVDGLAPDEAAIAFLRDRLGVAIVITRRPPLAARAVGHGLVSLLHVHCLDSTGLEHAMAAHPGAPVGTVVSPGPILPHLSPGQRARLPRPVVAYGLIAGPEGRDAALAAGADAVVVGDSSLPPRGGGLGWGGPEQASSAGRSQPLHSPPPGPSPAGGVGGSGDPD